jgi:CheY-like chemotaxis protein
MLPKVLWIEDGAYYELYNMLAPIYVAGCYDLVLAADATEAVRLLSTQEFDVVIVDIRIPPGFDPRWTTVYQQYSSNKDAARLGLHLLVSLFDPKRALVDLSDFPMPKLSRSKFAVFSVETDLTDELDNLQIKEYETKNASTPRTKVLEIIDRILNNNNVTVQI